MRLTTKELHPGQWLRVAWAGSPNTAVAIVVGEGPIVRAFFDRDTDGPVMQIRCPDIGPGTFPVQVVTEEHRTQVGRVKIR